MNPVQYAGELIERIITAVKQYGIHPRSPIVVRIGDFGVEMQIQHVKVQGGIDGPKIVLQLEARQ